MPNFDRDSLHAVRHGSGYVVQSGSYVLLRPDDQTWVFPTQLWANTWIAAFEKGLVHEQLTFRILEVGAV
jgi:hypothetical protein